MNLGFLFNLNKNHTPLEIDADSPELIEKMIFYFKKKYSVFPIEANDQAYLKLLKLRNKLNLVFNYSAGIQGEDRYAHFPSILELLQIPYTGSSPLTQALVLNKSKMYELLSINKIISPKTSVFYKNTFSVKQFNFPLLVKPNAQGTSAGITDKSVVFSLKELKKQIGFVNKTFKQPALVQPFIDGREFSISLLGNPPTVLPIVEFDYSKIIDDRLHFLPDTWDVSEYGDNFAVCPAKIRSDLQEKIVRIVLACWKSLDIRDFCRIDLRLDRYENIYVLDVNSPPALAPFEVETNNLFPLSAKKYGLEYGEMLDEIIRIALKRYKNKSS